MIEIPNVIDDKFLIENKELLNMKGEGTKETPFIIDDNLAIPINVIFKIQNLNLEINNVDLSFVIFDKCENIIVKDSIILIIKLKFCKNIIIKDNITKEIKNYFGKNIIIENNRIHSFANIRYVVALVFFIAIIAGLCSIFSYFFFFDDYRTITIGISFFCAIMFYLEISKKKNKRFISKKFRNNEFIDIDVNATSTSSNFHLEENDDEFEKI